MEHAMKPWGIFGDAQVSITDQNVFERAKPLRVHLVSPHEILFDSKLVVDRGLMGCKICFGGAFQATHECSLD